MLIANSNKELLTAGWVVGRLSSAQIQPRIAGLTASFFVKATFRLTPGGLPTPWEEGPDFASGDVPFGSDPGKGLGYASDFVPWKPRADFAAVSAAFPPPEVRNGAFAVRMQVGSQSKSLQVFGDRLWKEAFFGSSPGQPLPAREIPISYDQAWGGPEYLRNPLGKGRESAEMPHFELPGYRVESRQANLEPAGFAPIPAAWPQRQLKLGSYGGEWARTGWPWLPPDFDFSYFNATPPSQWLSGYLRGDEELVFENMHPERPLYETALPKLRARCFLTQTLNWAVDLPRDKAKREFREVPLDLDTLWVDMNAEKLVLVWRGRTPVRGLKLQDVDNLLILAEPLDAPHRRLGDYHRILVKELIPPSEPASPPAGPTAESLQAELDDALAEAERQAAEARKAMDEALESAAADQKKIAEEASESLRKAGEQLKKADPSFSGFTNITLPKQADLQAPFEQGLKFMQGDPKVDPLVIEALKRSAEMASKADPSEAEAKAVQDALISSADATEKKLEELQKQFLPKPEREVPVRDGKVDVEAVRREGLENVDGREIDFSGLDLAGVNFRGALLQGAKFVGSSLRGADLTDADLSEADLTRTDLTGAILRGVDLHQCVVEDTVWVQATLTLALLTGLPLAGADFSGARGKNTDFTGADLSGARFDKSQFPNGLFSNSLAEKASFAGARLFFADFRGTKAKGIQMPGADIGCLRAGEKADFTEANFRGAFGDRSVWESSCLDEADFRQASLPRSRFCEATLRGALFDRSDLTESVFEDAIAESAVLTNANLLRCNFDRADLTRARLDGSNLYESGFWDTVLLGATWRHANIRKTILAV